ncbi:MULTISPECIES: alpha/beta hydrolase [Acidobacterium]|uniref:Hydrolase, alpha/beta fold family n=1 Tax=Acidobacterium capsulatum (strain ATCC 51196 / DSM 11244 / BCRC 80197 / JCM 7670 / NBRC 15755 / NCIMB 13165 / 161) TaxID=240015 RepID=C1F7A9_ACIC5|nr:MULTISPECIES: alpha/beta hydrolase [Acidobacterium]ACO34445.1 hydrolase, alpha/beta fold family [Acidobacterium capsulatum ATCC 51196]HCT61044.1 alpha/beta hydrolase [Acidobacterium sp.]
MPLATIDGIHLAFDSFGNERDEALLLISGAGAQRIRWSDPFCEALAGRGFRVIRFDNRDAGESTHLTHCATPTIADLRAAFMAGRQPEIPYSLIDMANDAVALLDVLSIERAHIVGRSMGGAIAQVVAYEHADRVLSLTSIMSSSGNPSLPQTPPDVMAMMASPAPDPTRDLEGFLKHGIAFARRIAGSGYVFDERAYRALLLEELNRGFDPGGTGRQIAALATNGDRRLQLRSIQVPTLVVHGKDDPLILPACGEDTAASIEGARLLLIDGMGHDIPPVFHDVLIEAITRTAHREPANYNQKRP